MNVATCKYFLRGTCRYGDRCRFFHPPSGDQNYQGGQQQSGFYGGASNTVYGQIQESRYKLNENVKAIEEVVKKDMVEWEKGKIWPFSCYGPCAGKPNLDGFEDLSPEELRFATIQNQGVPPNSIALRFQLWNGARAKYQQTTQANLELLEAIIVGSLKPVSTTQNFGLGNTSLNTGSLGSSGLNTTQGFGQGNSQFSSGNFGNQTSAFGGKQFGSPSSTSFGASSNQPAISNFSFSLNKNPAQTESMEEAAYAQATAQTGFGTSSQALNTFSFNQAIASPAQPQQPAAINQGFSNLSPFQQQPQQSTMPAFSLTSQAAQPLVSNNPSQFGGGNFTGGMNTSPFGGNTMFGGQVQQQQAFNVPSFSDQQNKGLASLGGDGGGGDSYEKTVYSSIADLTPEDIRAFEAPQFDINSLPIRAPAKKFCF